MKGLIIGYGSIGVRQEQVLQDLGYEVAIVSRRKIMHEKVYHNLKEAITSFMPELIIIANETSKHLSTLNEIQNSPYKGKILVEKPLFQFYTDTVQDNNSSIYVGYNLRFNPMILKLKHYLVDEKICNVSFYVGQCLPMWRKNYLQSYSSSTALGGGVLRDLSHELDLCNWLFGDWESLTSLGGNSTSLKIESEDQYSILLQSKKCNLIQIHMNFLNKVFRREIIINTHENTYEIDLNQKKITKNGKTEQFNFDHNTPYENQIRDITSEKKVMACTFKEAIAVVNMIEKIEFANKEKIWVYNQLV